MSLFENEVCQIKFWITTGMIFELEVWLKEIIETLPQNLSAMYGWLRYDWKTVNRTSENMFLITFNV